MTIIAIHEFSTGIVVQGNRDEWWSARFREYMNSTLQEIPDAIQHSISNLLFKIAEGKATNNPAIIGREVEEKGDAWSIVAVVTRAKDEKGRAISVYRYFLSEGLGRINDLLTYQQINKLVFDPFDHQELGKPHLYDVSNTRSINILDKIFDDYSQILNEIVNNPLLQSTTTTNRNQNIPIKAIHQLAQEKSKVLGNQLIAWAYNVEGLTKPHDFLVIYSASSEADQYLQQSFQVKQQRVERKEGEQEILTVVRNWINQAHIQQDDIVTINNALLNLYQYNNDFWNVSIFRELGIYSSQSKSTYRLWLLHSLVFSEISKELLSLYDGKSKEKQYQPEVLELSRNIQHYLSGTLQLAIQFRAFQCVNMAVTNLVSDSKALEPTINCLTSDKENDGIFGTILKIGYIELLDQEFTRLYVNKKETIEYIINYYNQRKYQVLEQNIAQNLINLNEYIFRVWPSNTWESKSLENLSVLNTENWLSITDVIRKMIWFNNIKRSNLYKEYQVMAEFFENISQSPSSNRLAALFYHLSQGEIPTSVWKKCKFGLGQTLPLSPKFGNLEAIKRLATSANKSTSTSNSLPNLPPSSTSDSLDPQYRATKDKAILYGIPVRRKLTLLEKLQQYFGERFSLLFGLLFKSHQLPASGLILLALALLSSSAGYHIKELQTSHCKSPSLLSTFISKMPLIGVNCSNTSSSEKVTIFPSANPSPTSSSYPASEESIGSGKTGSGDWVTTAKSLDALRDEFAKAHNFPKDQVENAIVQVLSLNAVYRYKSRKSNNKPNSEVWIEGIKNFQDKTLDYTTYGFITVNDPTYNLLKCQVAKNLKITLKNPPFECDLNP